jgi:hypothetical protein
LNPVCPVRKTRLVFQNDLSTHAASAGAIQSHTFQGAFPDCHRSSR